jgi:hypothetical protein
MNYQIIFGIDTADLEGKVNELIDQGWLPAGGVAVDARCGDRLQAMISPKIVREVAALNRGD